VKPRVSERDAGASTAAAFRAAVERRDLDAVRDLLAPGIVFHSPVTFHPYVGRDTVAQLLSLVGQTFGELHYTDELVAEGAHALVFRTSVSDRELEGVDLLRIDEHGLIADLTVLLRPLSGLIPFAQAMGELATAAGLQTTPA